MSNSSSAESNKIGTSIRHAQRIIGGGGVVAFPTETSYGLAVDPKSTAAVQRLYEIKKREKEKAILLLALDLAQLKKNVREIPNQYQPLIRRYWPGPLTLIFPAADILAPQLIAKDGTIAIRISSHPVANALVKAFAGAITATSANISGKPPAKNAREVLESLGAEVDYILEGECLAKEQEACSTIIGLRRDTLQVLRQGCLEVSGIGIL